ncbi:MAG: glycosyl transferase [Alphaproteobacteria bacterium]|nr:glycosyl transferase [Alphaproteobacteria bacterium]
MYSLLKTTAKELAPDLYTLLRIMWSYKKSLGVFPNLIHPKTFNEKIQYRKLHDRRPLLTLLVDKYGAREYVAGKIGEQALPKLLFVTENPSDIPFGALPDKFVVKPTHGAGWVCIVTNKQSADTAEIVRKCNFWMNQNYYNWTREWAYRDVKPRIIVEEFIGDETGAVPIDYKLFVFAGKVAFIQVDIGRFKDLRRNIYDTTWNRIDVVLDYPNSPDEIPRPPHLETMIGYAQVLAEGIDFVSVDLYDTNEKVYFGEFTLAPGHGFVRFCPKKFDDYLGSLWRISL